MADEHKCMVWIGTGTPGVLECAECRQRVTVLSEPPADLRAALEIAKKAAEYGRGGRWNESLAVALARLDNMLPLDALSGDRPSPAECGCPCNCHADEGKPEWPGSCEACCNVEWGPLCECSRRLAAQLLKERTVGDRPSPEADPDAIQKLARWTKGMEAVGGEWVRYQDVLALASPATAPAPEDDGEGGYFVMTRVRHHPSGKVVLAGHPQLGGRYCLADGGDWPCAAVRGALADG